MKNKPLLTIGTSTFDDFDSLYFCIMDLRIHHKEAIKDCELLIVNQSLPPSPHTDMLKNFLGNIQKGEFANVRFVQMHEPAGTSPGRQHVFEAADAPYVLCMDSHVILPERGSLARLIQYYEDGKDEGDLLQGPMMMDNLVSYTTHMDEGFRSEMYGQWGSFKFDETKESYEIPMHGLGLFSSGKDAWLEYGGFNKRFRGFGSEEGYIHEKYKQAGHKTQMLTFLKWIHKFGRPQGVKYRLTREDKVRNYIIGWTEIGWDINIIKKHFMEEIPNPMNQATWDFIVHNIENNEEWPPQQTASATPEGASCKGDQTAKLSEQFKIAVDTPSDINEHLPTLSELAGKCESVIEFLSKPQASTVALMSGSLGGTLKRMRTHQKVSPCRAKTLLNMKGELELKIDDTPSLLAEIDEYDMAFIDTKHTREQLIQELNRFSSKIKKWIVVHDTHIFGERGEDGGPGVLVALREFMRANPEWTVRDHYLNNHGLTVITRDPEDKKKTPKLTKQGKNFLKSFVKHVATGANHASEDTYNKRMEICALCPQRADKNCSVCGCVLEKKTKWKTSSCPLGLWYPEEDK